MNTVFVLLFLLSIVGMFAGLVNPSWVKLGSRKKVGSIFGIATVIFAIVAGATAPKVSQMQSVATTQPSVSSSASAPTAPTTAQNTHPQTPTASVPSDKEYATTLAATVLVFLQSGNQDIMTASSDGSQGDNASALTNAQGAQAAFAQAKKGLAALPTPPADMVQVKTIIGKALDSYAHAADQLVTGIKSQNASTVRDAQAYITQGEAYVTQANGLIEQLNGQ